jgi:hypothetical protein
MDSLHSPIFGAEQLILENGPKKKEKQEQKSKYNWIDVANRKTIMKQSQNENAST